MSDFNKNFISLSANLQFENTCESFLKNKFGKFNETDHYLVQSLANGNLELLFHLKLLIFI